MVMRPVVIPRSYQTVPAGDSAAVHARDVLLNLPLRSETLGCEDELIHPEKDQSPDQVCDNGCNPLAHGRENNTDPGEYRSARLPPEQVEPVAFVIDLHTDESCARVIGVAMVSVPGRGSL